MRRRIPPTPYALALAAHPGARRSVLAVVRRRALAFAGLTVLALAMGTSLGKASDGKASAHQSPPTFRVRHPFLAPFVAAAAALVGK